MDNAGIFSRNTQMRVEAALRALHEQGGSQITVVTLPDLGGVEPEQATIQMYDKWKLGNVKDDRGVIFLISRDDHKMRIEVGRGLEGILPDVIAKRIIEDDVAPLFRSGSFDDGLTVGIYRIVSVSDPNFDIKSYLNANMSRRRSSRGDPSSNLIVLIIFAVFFLLRLLFRGRGFYGGGWSGGGFGGGGWSGGGGSGGWGGGGGSSSGGGASGGW